MNITVKSTDEMQQFGARLGSVLTGGAVLELVGDVGAGKTTLAKGIAAGMGIEDNIQSPSFTISQIYETKDHVRLAHYDFYRLQNAGIMSNELDEVLHDPRTISLIEWAAIVKGVLPDDRLTISIVPDTETSREISVIASGPTSKAILEKL